MNPFKRFVQQSLTAQNTELNAFEYEAMNDIEIGLTDGPIAEYRGISGVATTPPEGTSALNRRALWRLP